MDDTYGEFQGTELDPSLDFDFEDDEENDLLPILGLAAFFAAVVGGVLVLVGRRHQPTAAERVQEALGSAGDDGKKALKAASKAVESSQLGDLLDEALNRVHELSSNGDAHKLLRSAQKRAGDITSSGTVQDVLDEARSRAKQAQKRAKKAAKNIDLGDAGQSAQKRAADLVASVGLADLLAEAISRAGDAAKHAPDLRDSAA